MSYYRSYFEKNNTLIKDSQVNTSKNPTTEIFYGSGFSKFIFKVDFTTLKDKVINGELVVDSNTKHTLHMTNTIFGDEGLKGENKSTGRDRTTSFDLIIFKIGQYWDEGIGFDYENQSYDFVSGNRTFDERPSNWFYRTTMNTWTSNGVYSNNPIIVASQHFDNGNEDLNVDITDYVNGVLSGDTNQGLGVAFALVYQDLNVDIEQSVAFFTKYTQTFFEPYVESYFQDNVSDNRMDFVDKIPQNLYLYVSQNSNFVNLDDLPIVDILDGQNNPISGLMDLTTKLIRKGVYSVTFTLDNAVFDGKRFYYDKWKNLMLSGVTLSNVTQKFIPKSITNQITIGKNPTESHRYATQFYGIKLSERIKRGDIRKVVVTFRSIDLPKTVVLDQVYYRMFIEEGANTQVIVHDWTLIDKATNENFFYLDTSYLIPREYKIEFKGISHGEEIHYKDTITFYIVSEK